MFRRKISDTILGLSLAVITLAAFSEVGRHEFIEFDDYLYILENPYVSEGLTWRSLWWALSADFISDSPYADFWIPITYLSHLATAEIFGVNPSGHHWTNLAFHTLNVILLYWILRQMTGLKWPSTFVALLFGIHPLHVESVAWITERKDVLSTFFLFLSMAAYIRYVQKPNFRFYFWVMVFFVLGLMSKPMVVTLPFILLLLDFWPLGRLTAKTQMAFPQIHSAALLFREKLPLFVLSAAFSILTFLSAEREGSVSALEVVPLQARIQNALSSYISYMWKTIYPVDLAIFYPFPIDPVSLWQALVPTVILLSISVLAIMSFRSRPYFLMGWFWYLGTLIPVIGILQVGSQSMADRYTYIPIIGLFLIGAWGIPELLNRWIYRKAILSFLAGFISLTCFILTRHQVEHWKNTSTLFQHTLEVTENNYMASNNIGVLLIREGKSNDAVPYFLEALRIKPDFSMAHYNLGIALSQQDRLDEAMVHYSNVLPGSRNHPDARFNMGAILLQQGKKEEAIKFFEEVLEAKPDYPRVQYNLGNILRDQGRHQEAIDAYRSELTLRPDDPWTLNNIGLTHKVLRQYDEAIEYFHRGLKEDPENARMHYNLGDTYFKKGEFQRAIHQFETALEVDSNFAEAYYSLGGVYEKIGRIEEAKTQYEKALEANPDFGHAHEAIRSLP